jgi:hypothetical protein
MTSSARLPSLLVNMPASLYRLVGKEHPCSSQPEQETVNTETAPDATVVEEPIQAEVATVEVSDIVDSGSANVAAEAIAEAPAELEQPVVEQAEPVAQESEPDVSPVVEEPPIVEVVPVVSAPVVDTTKAKTNKTKR